MAKKTVKFEKVDLGKYRTVDGMFDIKLEGYNKYKIYKHGEYISWAHTVNEAKEIVRNHVALYEQ